MKSINIVFGVITTIEEIVSLTSLFAISVQCCQLTFSACVRDRYGRVRSWLPKSQVSLLRIVQICLQKVNLDEFF